MRVLCVDDDRISLTLMTRFLSGAFPADEIDAAPDGERAIAMLGDREVDLVITDLVMPGISGLDLVLEARRRRPDIEVIVITAHSSVETAVEAMKRGARDYLPKPFNYDLVREKIENVREMLASRAEAADWRYAKEMMEAGLGRTVRGLEGRLAERDALLAGAARILESGLAPEVLVRSLREHLLTAASPGSS